MITGANFSLHLPQLPLDFLGLAVHGCPSPSRLSPPPPEHHSPFSGSWPRPPGLLRALLPKVLPVCRDQARGEGTYSQVSVCATQPSVVKWGRRTWQQVPCLLGTPRTLKECSGGLPKAQCHPAWGLRGGRGDTQGERLPPRTVAWAPEGKRVGHPEPCAQPVSSVEARGKHLPPTQSSFGVAQGCGGRNSLRSGLQASPSSGQPLL